MIKGKENRRRMRHRRFIKKHHNPAGKPRLVVRKSLKHIYAVLVDDRGNRVITGVSSLTPAVREALAARSTEGPESRPFAAARLVGEELARKAAEGGIPEVVFDRAGYIYRGRVKVLAESARAAGLKF